MCHCDRLTEAQSVKIRPRLHHAIRVKLECKQVSCGYDGLRDGHGKASTAGTALADTHSRPQLQPEEHLADVWRVQNLRAAW